MVHKARLDDLVDIVLVFQWRKKSLVFFRGRFDRAGRSVL
jgi:hypothetical protein